MEQKTLQNSISNEMAHVPTPHAETPASLQEPSQHQALHKRNIYPIVRHSILIAIVLITLCLIFFLVHQNGKSIYENGI